MKTYYRNLKKNQKDLFARRAGTSRAYIEKKLIPLDRKPSLPMILSLVEASDGDLTIEHLLEYFYPEILEKYQTLKTA